MTLIVETASKIGFCFGVKRCIDILEKAAQHYGSIESLGAPVHNQQVLTKLASQGIHIAASIGEIRGSVAAISAHGVGPLVEAELSSRFSEVLNTTCPFVHRTQIAAKRLAKAGFYVIVYGEANHPEVKGILGWADGNGIATLEQDFASKHTLPRRLGILSQTTSIQTHFSDFAKNVVESALVKDGEIRIIDTICHDMRERQQSSLDLARRVEIMLVIGSRTSANSKHLAELCATVTETHLIENGGDMQPDWFKNRRHVGVTSGASTPDETIDLVLTRLKSLD
ncbi:MAG: 4-hydroxy-3-methylbut-2-enyl diphosphate reductase [Dehalococcoidales bacterium]|nr:4-hydroxy-3-methylbut-2-enyl diphosphate reductase [Dehalococcoidales bacterium]